MKTYVDPQLHPHLEKVQDAYVTSVQAVRAHAKALRDTVAAVEQPSQKPYLSQRIVALALTRSAAEKALRRSADMIEGLRHMLGHLPDWQDEVVVFAESDRELAQLVELRLISPDALEERVRVSGMTWIDHLRRRIGDVVEGAAA